MGTSLQIIDRLVPGANLESYIQAASRIPVLSVEEERKLAERLHYDGDALDQGRDSRVYPAQLAHRESGDHQGAA